ncbi:sigma-70 family RNA polymerase sigma factor [Streptomyces sp. SID5785]|uniref:sigma-70 family RNA polymerase sigma factor n=1 Tax=Streptomyces sp. SID5785 TaxID=2690309 RepID=UPI001360E11D|nr:sigma-70 family RNA polymerase sigma factor [Streptomyces sp. SID5785]MZD04249.1 sigma-70 family RNA polymerase sigma factor [Streptomyces sp. SID5785]
MSSERHGAMIRAAQSGDRRAQDEVVAAYLPLVYNVVGRALDGHADVDDVVQETMIRALSGLPALRSPERFRSWLVAIAMNQVRNRWQAQHAAPRYGELGEAHELADPGADFVDLTIVRMGLSGQRREVAEATRWLEPADRELLSLWWLEAAGELTRAEVAAAMELSQAHTAVRVQRMKAHLENARVIVRAMSADPRCVLLEETLEAWDGTPSPLWRKRLARHARSCTVCSRLGSGLVPAEGLLAGLGLVPVGATLAGGPAPDAAGLAAHGAADGTGSGGDHAPTGQGHAADGARSSRSRIRHERRARRRRNTMLGVAVLVAGGGAVGVLTDLAPDDGADTVRTQSAPVPSAPVTPSSPSASASADRSPSPEASPSRGSARPTREKKKTSPPPRPKPAPTTKRPAPPAPAPTQAPSGSFGQQVTQLVNAERAENGCAPVTQNGKLDTAALRHSDDMADRDYFDHTDPDGKDPGDRITAAGYSWSTYGENIARGQQTPAQVMDSWMNSPGHRANILNCAFKEIGLGVHEGSGGPWWTQVFGTSS